ncbi:MAG: ComEC family competence protein [Chlorobiaceae bacterium]|nr:ComEC family competence protein [Chlorobiaceae bacterium]
MQTATVIVLKKRKNIQNNDLPGIKNIAQATGFPKVSLAPYPALKLLLPAIAGIVAGVYFPAGLSWWLWGCAAAGIALLAGLVFEKAKRTGSVPLPFNVFSFLCFICLSFAASACYRYAYVPQNGLLAYADRQVILTGRIAMRPEMSSKGVGMLMETGEVFCAGKTANVRDRCRVFVRNLTGSSPEFRYGDMVRVKGTLDTLAAAANRGEYSPRQAGRLEQVSVQLFAAGPWLVQNAGPPKLDLLDRYVVLPVYGYIVQSMRRLMPEGNERRLSAGVLTGEKEFLPEEIFEEFKITGTAHILAVSGLNVGLLALLVHVALQRLKATSAGRWISLLLVLFLLLVYSRVTGNSSSVVRASIMAAVFATGQAAGRKTYPLNSLALSDFLILASNPLDLLGPGFQMTNGAVISILLFNAFSNRHSSGNGGVLKQTVRFFRESFVVTLAAIIGVSPVIAYYFGTFSLVSIVANIPVVLFSTLLMYALLPMLMVNLVSAGAASFFAESAILFAKLTLASAGFFSAFPLASVSVKPDLADLMIYYATLVAALYLISGKAWGKLAVTLLLGTNLIFWHEFFRFPSDPPSLVTVNLGRNIATLCTAGGRTVQIDAGSARREEKRILRQCGEYGLFPPDAAVQFFSADSVVSAVPSRCHMLKADSLLVLPSMVVSRPGEKILRISSRERSVLFVSGTSRLKENVSCTGDIVFLWVYRFDAKQRDRFEAWLEYAHPKRCVLVPGSFLSRSALDELLRFVDSRSGLEIRSKTRQVVIP